jgi:hypothetical protein
LKLRDTGLTGFARGDGAKYLAVSADTRSVTVLDVDTGARRTVPGPAGDCGFRDIHAGTLLWTCNNPQPSFNGGVTYDLATGQVGALPQLQLTPGTFGAEGATYTTIGTQGARALYAGYHIQIPVYIARATGQPQTIAPARGRIVDLDAPSLTRKLCSGQRRPYVTDAEGFGVELGDLAIAGRRAAATTLPAADSPQGAASRVELQRCGAKPRILKVCRTVSCTQPVINDDIVAWVEIRRSRARLVVRSLRTGATRATPMRGYPQVPGVLAPLLVGKRLYLVSGDQVLRVRL